jgi:hypothetical protein
MYVTDMLSLLRASDLAWLDVSIDTLLIALHNDFANLAHHDLGIFVTKPRRSAVILTFVRSLSISCSLPYASEGFV